MGILDSLPEIGLIGCVFFMLLAIILTIVGKKARSVAASKNARKCAIISACAFVLLIIGLIRLAPTPEGIATALIIGCPIFIPVFYLVWKKSVPSKSAINKEKKGSGPKFQTYEAKTEACKKFVDKTERAHRRHKALAVYSAVLMPVSLILGYVMILADEKNVLLRLLGLIVLVCGWIPLFQAIKQNRVRHIPDRIYQECVRKGFTKLQDPVIREKLRILLKNYELSGNDEEIVEIFEYCRIRSIGWEQYEKEVNELVAQRKAEQEKEIPKKYVRVNQENYIHLVGREKRAAYYRDRIAEGKILMREGKASASASDHYQSKHSSSIAGGIAQGIAGPAAGLAAYARTEAKNAQIDAQNKASHAMYSMMASVEEAIYKAGQQKVAGYQQMLDNLQYKLIDENYTAKKIMDQLEFNNIQLTVQENGYVTISLVVKTQPVKILGSRDAVVDGTIVATLWKNGKEWKSASLAFPTPQGLKEQCTLTHVFKVDADPDEQYSVTFTAENLWVIEYPDGEGHYYNTPDEVRETVIANQVFKAARMDGIRV